jgi:DNA/RNA-binding domain of Phe-tRNA-synthetase-like protein
LFDRGYISLNTDKEAIVMKRKPRGRMLSQEACQENDRIEHDRVIVESWNQRYKALGRDERTPAHRP